MPNLLGTSFIYQLPSKLQAQNKSQQNFYKSNTLETTDEKVSSDSTFPKLDAFVSSVYMVAINERFC